MKRCAGALLLAAAMMFLPQGLLRAQAPVTYLYDNLGRLVGVVNGAGESAMYEYDAVGNLLSIQRISAGTVSVMSVNPGSGPVGSTVTISGTGYSAVPSQNSVSFNGTAATVTASSGTQLTVTVPANATTGTVSVTAPAGSAAGGPFTVTSAGTPTITGFAPPIAPAGSSVTITGTNFSTVPLEDRTQFNRTFSGVQTATVSTLTTTVPDTATSGHITVTTPTGLATSVDDFFIPPPPYVASDVLFTGRMSIGGSLAVPMGTANKIGLVVFDGEAGHRVSVRGTNWTTHQVLQCDVTVKLLRPGLIAAPICMEDGSFEPSAGFIDATLLPSTASYTLFVDPYGAATGSVTLTVYDVRPDFSGTIVPAAQPQAVTVEIDDPGQNGSLTFSGTAGQRVALKATSNQIAGQISVGCDVTVTIRKPDTLPLVSGCMESTNYIDTVTLPATGTYTIAVDPFLWAVGDIALALYDVPADYSGSIAPNSTAVPITLSTGQNAALTFSGTDQQRVSLTVDLTTGSFGCSWTTRIKGPAPSNPTVANVGSCLTSVFIGPVVLNGSGTYTIEIDPAASSAGSANVTLHTITDDTQPIQINGSPVSTSLQTPGQRALLPFSGTQGQAVTAAATITSGSFGYGWILAILKPDGTVLVQNGSCCSTNSVNSTSLPTSGTYKVLVDPVGTSTGSATVTLTSP